MQNIDTTTQGRVLMGEVSAFDVILLGDAEATIDVVIDQGDEVLVGYRVGDGERFHATIPASRGVFRLGRAI